MPILLINDVYLERVCANCNERDRVHFASAQITTSAGPFNIPDGATASIAVDRDMGNPIAIPLAMNPITTPEQLVAAITQATNRVEPAVEFKRLVIRSSTRGPESEIQLLGDSKVIQALGMRQTVHVAPKVGRTIGTESNHDVVSMPACAECGALESFVRQWDKCPDDYMQTFHGRQRCMVNAMIQRMVADGYSDPDSMAAHQSETASPVDRLAEQDIRDASIEEYYRVSADAEP